MAATTSQTALSPAAQTQHLQHEVERSRQQVQETLDELRAELQDLAILDDVRRWRARAAYEQGRLKETARRADRYARSGPSLSDWVRQHPVEALVAAFGVGFLLGSRPFQ